MTLSLRLRLLVPVLRLLKSLGWRSSADARPFGDERNPLVAQALAAIPGRVGSAATLRIGFLDPHPPACQRVQIHALFSDGQDLFEYMADHRPDCETWSYEWFDEPFAWHLAEYSPLVRTQEEGRDVTREFYYHLQQTDDGFRVGLRDTPPRRFPTRPEMN